MLTGSGAMLMPADAQPPREGVAGDNVSLALGGDEAEVIGYWDKLSEGGTVITPFSRSPWGALCGRYTDKFAASWLVNIGTGSST